jgi:hypothetical protein
MIPHVAEPANAKRTTLQPEDLTAEWLTGQLRETGRLRVGQVVSIETAPRPTSEAVVAKVRVAWSSDAAPDPVPSLFFKASRSDLKGNRQRGLNEVRFYTAIAPELDPSRVAACLNAARDVDTGAYHLLLEDLSASHFQNQWPLPPANEQCDAIVDCLASIHARWWDDPRLSLIARLPNEASVAGSATWIQKTLPKFFDTLGDRLAAPRRAVYETLAATYVERGTRLTGRRNLTIIHGDAHSWNFMLPRDPSADSVRLIDWAAWHCEMGLMDVAYLIAVHWHPERRARLEQPLVRRYHRRLLENGVRGYTWEECWSDYRYCTFRSVMVPLWQWAAGLPAALWWPHLERSLAAFEDLRCAESI